MNTVESQQVSFWAVHEFAQERIDAAGHYPMAGTPAWCALPDRDRRKWAALLDFAQHHALRVETAQEQRAAAGRAIAGAANWSQIARDTAQRARVYIRREAR